jgi:hypothetical protein
MTLQERRRPAGATEAPRDPAAHEQPLPRGLGALLEKLLEAAGGEDVAAQVGFPVARAGDRVLCAGPNHELAVLRTDHALRAAQLEAHLAIDHRPALLLARMEVTRQAAARLDPCVDEEVLAIGLEGVARAMDGVADLLGHRSLLMWCIDYPD